ncbi:hypothetical protein ABER75_05420 [Niallia taxi]|uniref:hypothetical protein n=1 Tax=Niallia taxi TaxID=2499688 RepID=UPI0028708610|nr:hypothetical protein [Niallia taxi]
MFDYGLLNIGSIVLGLIALAIPTYCLIKKENEKSIALSSISYAAWLVQFLFVFKFSITII